MRSKIRTLSKAISTLVVLCVLFVGMAVDSSAQRRGRSWERSHSRGRHLGWERGRRVGQRRRNNNRWDWRRRQLRNRRTERRHRRSSWDNNRNWQRNSYQQSGSWRNR